MVDRSSDRRPSASSVRATDRQTGRPSDRWMGTSELECLSNRADWQPRWLSSTDRKENERANERTKERATCFRQTLLARSVDSESELLRSSIGGGGDGGGGGGGASFSAFEWFPHVS